MRWPFRRWLQPRDRSRLPELVPQLSEKIEALGRAFARAERHGRGYPDPRAAQEQFRRLHALLMEVEK
jgi:hypothetical protein